MDETPYLSKKEQEVDIKKMITKGRVDRLEAKGQPKGLSAKTVRNIHQILSSALKLAQEQRIILTNPAEGCALPKVEHREMKTLPVEQLQSFLREARESGVFELYYLELATGLRRGELLGLKWEDIDLERGDLRVKRQVARINGEITEAPLKTKNAYRTLPLAEDTVSVLLEQKKKAGSSPWVFLLPNGGPISPDSVLHMLHLVVADSISLAPSRRDRARSLRGSSSPCVTRCAGLAQGNSVVSVRYAGSLLCRIHPGHLRPCDQRRSVPGGTNYGECTVRQSLTLSEMLQPFPLKFPVWVTVWVKQQVQK